MLHKTNAGNIIISSKISVLFEWFRVVDKSLECYSRDSTKASKFDKSTAVRFFPSLASLIAAKVSSLGSLHTASNWKPLSSFFCSRASNLNKYSSLQNIRIQRIILILCKQDWLYKITYLTLQFPK